MACEHEVLSFASGDYYVVCSICGDKWGKLSLDQPEYGWDERGEPIGCSPSSADIQPRGDRVKIPNDGNTR